MFDQGGGRSKKSEYNKWGGKKRDTRVRAHEFHKKSLVLFVKEHATCTTIRFRVFIVKAQAPSSQVTKPAKSYEAMYVAKQQETTSSEQMSNAPQTSRSMYVLRARCKSEY